VREYGGHGVAAVGASERGVGRTTRAAAPAAKKLRKTKKQDVKDEPRVEVCAVLSLPPFPYIYILSHYRTHEHVF
jgi:hypothetical protein